MMVEIEIKSLRDWEAGGSLMEDSGGDGEKEENRLGWV
jgi:hypothetical protein